MALREQSVVGGGHGHATRSEDMNKLERRGEAIKRQKKGWLTKVGIPPVV